jgi:hypothetical protein
VLLRGALLNRLADQVSRNNPKHMQLKSDARAFFQMSDRMA